jgi:ADP-ribose pyrophosphatase
MAYELIQSRLVYPGRAFSIRQDTIRLPDSRQAELDIVDHVGSVVILPVDRNGNILFVRQYRHATSTHILELPAGTLEIGEQPEACAHRELREETGMAAGTMQHLGGFYLAPGYSTEYMHVFLATDLGENPLKADSDEFISLEKVPVSRAMEMSNEGLLPDAKSLAAFHLARKYLEKWQ